jgi:2-polyprenyl-3-methyl-5-hydroxy-6-metoxy-1,4-benzoquinol methylase
VLPDPLVHPLDDNRCLVELIAAVMEEPEGMIRQQLRDEERDLGKYHREDFARHGLTPHVWDERLECYYRELSVWLPSYAVWNRRAEKLKMRAWIGGFLARQSEGGLRVLTVGDGAGFDSLYLAQCGHQVSYWELSERAVAFATRIFRLGSQPVRVIRETAELLPESYDVVVCLDVLEHVPDPPTFVRQLSGYLRSGGLFIVHAPFFFVTEHCPTHLLANRKYSGEIRRLYGAAGLHPIAGRFFWTPLVLQKQLAEAAGRRRAPSFPLLPRLGGLLLSVARVWPWPHEWMAIRARGKIDPRWQQGLEPPERS